MRACLVKTRRILGLLGLAAIAACHAPLRTPPTWTDARQMILVTTADWDANHGRLRRYERDARGWHAAGDGFDVAIGRNGAAWGVGLHEAQAGPRKQEGDGRSPAGVFALGTAFGYAGSARTAWPYAAMTAEHWCVDVDGSPLYNRIVDAREVGADAVAGSTEPMRRDLHADGDVRYELGLVVEHNPRNRRGDGSCIFAHLWRTPGEATAGCTAMARADMQALLAWLRPDEHPVFVLLPEAEYARLREAWRLP
ncbi:L,D-transpeptidase family protein [Dokdonella sp.]|uniref:L,D-transpeptidase family protein n=1 Tax=Dokdonella sp. TaxID=2291710 RepID=UPI001B1A94F6|nr:L,D-transpeptidase family protein [Dokdonella sp.]MBO9663771.1 hypothetical protein [Dokdonella sp.]